MNDTAQQRCLTFDRMAESSPKSEDTDSPGLSYSMALREGKRIVAKLAELMATPIADIEEPSLVDLTLSSSLASTPGASGDDVPRRQLFKSPAAQDGGAVWALDKLHVGDPRNSRPDGVPNHPASSDIAGSAPSSEPEAKHGGNSVNGGGLLFDAYDPSSLKSRRDGAVQTAPTSTETPVEESPDQGRDTMPLVFLTPVLPRRKPTRGFLAPSVPEVAVPDRLADEERLVVPSDRPLSLTRAKAVDPVEVDEAAATLPVPSDTTFDKRLSFVVVPAAEPVEADEDAAAASSPDLPTSSDTRDWHVHSSETGEDSFRTAYEFPVHPSRGSFVISRDEPPVLSHGVASGDQDLPGSASGGALTSEELPNATVVAEATFATPALPTKCSAKPRVKACASAAADTTVVLAPRKPASKPAGSTLATRKSLLPPPAAFRRPERLAPTVKARVPLGRPSGALKAAPRAEETTFAVNAAAQVAPPGCAPKVVPLQQPKKQEQPSVRPKVPAPRGPVSERPVAASPASRQSMPAPGVASGATRRIAAGRRSVVTKTAVPPASSVAARPARPPLAATTTNAAAGAKFPRKSALTGLGEASKTRVSLPKPPQASGKPKPEPRGQPQAQKAPPSRSGIAAPKTRVAEGFSRLPTMAGSSAGTRVALLPPVPESPVPTRVSSTPLRADLPALDKADFPELTPIRRQ